ncbi:MAG: site-specific integrase [Ferruginibacter sp.]
MSALPEATRPLTTPLKKFRGDIRVNEITPAYLKEYEGWMMNQKGRSKTTVGIHARCFRAVINEAIELKLMSRDDYPFGRRRYRIPTGKNIKKAMDKESIAKLYYTKADTDNQQKGKDFWFFSFFGNGMNVKDMVSLKYGDIKGEFLVFERAKTQLTTMRDPIVISCFLNTDMRKTIEKYGNADTIPSNYIFPVLTHGLTPIRMDDLIHNFVAFINHNMAKMCQKANLPKNVGTMETRHSASTIMKNAGVPPHYIKEQLGHTSLQTTENYLAGFENTQKKEFAKVLESFKKFKPKKG